MDLQKDLSQRKVNAVFVCIIIQDCGDRINTFDEDQDFRLRTSEKYVYVFEIQLLLIFFLDLKYWIVFYKFI